jgi:membrane protein DedA with SNARE-associated domain
MSHLIFLIERHGYLVIFLFVLAEALGLPLPASIALIAGGAAVASGVLSAPLVIVAAITALLLGDSTFYFLGRYTGWSLLGFLCKVSVSPETCILRSAEMFYKRGKATLVFSKFIPGVNAMAAPLAGSMQMRFRQFIGLDLAGATLYVVAFSALGYLFHDFVAAIAHGLTAAAHMTSLGLLLMLTAFVGYRVWLYSKGRIYRAVPRIEVEALAQKLNCLDPGNILLVDVRSKGYYDRNAARIRGSIRFEPNNLSEELKKLPKDKEIYLYCT